MLQLHLEIGRGAVKFSDSKSQCLEARDRVLSVPTRSGTQCVLGQYMSGCCSYQRYPRDRLYVDQGQAVHDFKAIDFELAP